jgi:putative membrane protein
MSDSQPSRNDLAARSTALADKRTRLAFDRTKRAAERTLMAWIRTSLAMISFASGLRGIGSRTRDEHEDEDDKQQ